MQSCNNFCPRSLLFPPTSPLFSYSSPPFSLLAPPPSIRPRPSSFPDYSLAAQPAAQLCPFSLFPRSLSLFAISFSSCPVLQYLLPLVPESLLPFITLSFPIYTFASLLSFAITASLNFCFDLLSTQILFDPNFSPFESFLFPHYLSFISFFQSYYSHLSFPLSRSSRTLFPPPSHLSLFA